MSVLSTCFYEHPYCTHSHVVFLILLINRLKMLLIKATYNDKSSEQRYNHSRQYWKISCYWVVGVVNRVGAVDRVVGAMDREPTLGDAVLRREKPLLHKTLENRADRRPMDQLEYKQVGLQRARERERDKSMAHHLFIAHHVNTKEIFISG